MCLGCTISHVYYPMMQKIMGQNPIYDDRHIDENISKCKERAEKEGISITDAVKEMFIENHVGPTVDFANQKFPMNELKDYWQRCIPKQ